MNRHPSIARILHAGRRHYESTGVRSLEGRTESDPVGTCYFSVPSLRCLASGTLGDAERKTDRELSIIASGVHRDWAERRFAKVNVAMAIAAAREELNNRRHVWED